MANNLLDQLANVDVPPPPPPAEFDRQLHERVNRTLLVVQLIDFAVRALPWAVLHFANALRGLVSFTLTGHYQLDRRTRQRKKM
jgi:hypothetical protein